MGIFLNKCQLDLGSTSIENIFINDFMPSADGSFVKVYIMGLKLLKEGQGGSVKASDMADLLGILENDVYRAWDYWEKQNLIKIKRENDEMDIYYVNLKELYIKNVWNTENKSRENFSQIVENPQVANFLSRIEFLLRKSISPMQKQDIYNWIGVYNMPMSLIEEAFFFVTEIKNIYNVKYVEKVVRDWSEKNIRTPEKLEENFKEHEKKYYNYNFVMKSIGLTKKTFNQFDFDLINSWYSEFSEDIIEEALSKTVNIQSPNLGYVNGVLENWKKSGYTSLDQIRLNDTKDKKVKKVGPNFKNLNKKTDSYTGKELEDIAKKKVEKLLDSMDKGE